MNTIEQNNMTAETAKTKKHRSTKEQQKLAHKWLRDNLNMLNAKRPTHETAAEWASQALGLESRRGLSRHTTIL